MKVAIAQIWNGRAENINKAREFAKEHGHGIIKIASFFEGKIYEVRGLEKRTT